MPLDSAQRSVEGSDTAAGEPLVVPASFAEERIWFLHALADEGPLYSVPVAFGLRGQLDLGALEEAFRVVASRQENLRASYREHEGRPIKLVHPAATGEPLVRLDAEEPWALIDELIAVPFDLEEPPLLRAYLIESGTDDRILFLNVHHIVFDDRSVVILVREVEEVYKAVVSGREAELPALRIQYPDYAGWQRKLVGGPEWRAEEEFWRARLDGPPARLEVGRDPAGARAITGDRCEFMIGWNLMAAVRAASQDLGVTPFSFLLAAFQLTLSERAGAAETVIGIPVDNRELAEVRGLIGFFVNTVAIPLTADAGRSVEEHVRDTQGAVREALANSQLPFQAVVQAVDAARHNLGNPLFNVAFAMRKELLAPSLPGVVGRWLPVHNHMATFELMMMIEEHLQDAVGFIEFADTVSVDRVEAFASDYLRLLALMTAAPGTAVRSVLASSA